MITELEGERERERERETQETSRILEEVGGGEVRARKTSKMMEGNDVVGSVISSSVKQ